VVTLTATGLESLKMSNLTGDEDAQEDQPSVASRAQKDDVPKKKRKRRPPVIPWKKPKDMPRRPLSAYNIFFREKREEMMSANRPTEAASEGGGRKGSASKSVGIGFANLARTIAGEWKNLDEKSKAPYIETAREEKERYNREMVVWRAKQQERKATEASRAILGATPRSGSLEAEKPVASWGDESPKKPKNVAHMDLSPIQVPGMGDFSRWSSLPSSATGLASFQRATSNPYDAGHSSLSQLFGVNMSSPDRRALGQGSGHSLAILGRGEGSQLSHWRQEQVDSRQQQGQLHDSLNLSQHQSYPQFGRRNTWSSGHDEQGFLPPSMESLGRPYQNQEEMAYSAMQRSPENHGFPESWFEVERSQHRMASAPARATRPSTQSHALTGSAGVAMYPENWFEVQGNQERHVGTGEPTTSFLESRMQVSTDGDLTGKLPSIQSSCRNRKWESGGDSSKSSDRSFESKQGEQAAREPSTASLDPLSTGNNPVVESSLQTLGLQLDDESVDFLTRSLTFNRDNQGK